MLPRPSSPTPPRQSRPPPPTCPFHPNFLSRSAPASDFAVIGVGEQCMLFFVGRVHQVEVCKGGQRRCGVGDPLRHVRRCGIHLPEGQELVGPFAYRLVSGHWRVQKGVSRIGEEGTVTMGGVFGLNVVTGWDKRRPEWVDVAWLAMRVHVGRQRKMRGG